MTRLRLERWSGQLARANVRVRCSSQAPCLAARHARPLQQSRFQSTSADQSDISTPPPSITTSDAPVAVPAVGPPTANLESSRSPYPSPLPEAALKSAKLSALHARLCLSSKLPLQTLARALVDPSADENPNFNNASLAFLGGSIINYHTTELLVTKYPRLPMAVMFEAVRGYAGGESLYHVARGWGVESAAAPGGEVDPGLLQWSQDPSKTVKQQKWGFVRTESAYIDKFKWRRGWSSRVVYDDPFGDMTHKNTHTEGNAPGAPKLPADIVAERRKQYEAIRNEAHASFVKALTGAIYLHCGREMAKSFTKAHILSRNLDIDRMFAFHAPLMELSKLCAREGFDRPVARLESETGRLSRTPVYVVGIYSGKDKLGEGVGASLDFARWKACISSLKAWYLYSPSSNPRVPSDMLVEGAKPWQAPYIDIGEVMI
ncbi:related to ribosomal protein YmL3 [Cephalotrichum gorgonifer]|uniref:Large ribosomal subunit protein mL44 n=1 Tax=Cephalotrichum gorgonifer TaxID=2041049 RepID=A0AAE8SSC7_9PEZI|nr:related to ribosomal protein YmL3 [Cephalotrichum gorgonifer]